MDELSHILDGKTDVIGFVYAINGEINTAEIYNNKTLFRALWPKLLDSAITEAISACSKDVQTPKVQPALVKAFFEMAVSGSVKERRVWKTTLVKAWSTPTTVMFETVDLDADSTWIHKSFIQREKETTTVPLDGEGRELRQQSRY